LTIEDAIYHKLTTELPVLSNRIYPVSAPQKATQPYIVYKRISTVRSPTLCEQGSREVSIQFDIYGRTYPEMRSIREDLRAAFEDVIGEYAPGSPYVQRAEIVNEFDGYDVGTDVTTGVIEIQFFYN
jgi:hypothetical protein